MKTILSYGRIFPVAGIFATGKTGKSLADDDFGDGCLAGCIGGADDDHSAVAVEVEADGALAGGCGEHEVLRKALEVLSDKKDTFLSVDMTNDFAGEEGMVCGGTMDVIIQYVPGKVGI